MINQLHDKEIKEFSFTVRMQKKIRDLMKETYYNKGNTSKLFQIKTAQ